MLPYKTKKIFISYSHNDIQLVEALEKLIIKRKDLAAVIIANNREAQKPLVEKVSNGIVESDIIIPILTRNSKNAQWINQEIGYASALGKSLFPLIEKDILSELKGFVHEEVDQPYLFETEVEQGFLKKAQLLLNDIPIEKGNNTPKKQSTLDLAEEIRSKKQYEAERLAFKEDPHTVDTLFNELYDKMFPYLEDQLEEVRKRTGLPFPNEISSNNPHGYIIKSEGYCFSIVWTKRFRNSIDNSPLYVKFWEKYISFENRSFAPSEKPKEISTISFDIDIDFDLKLIWQQKEKQRALSSNEIVDMCFEWLLKVIRGL